MPIDSIHPKYRYYQNALIDCRNAFEGGRAIKAAGQRYLPRLKSQRDDDYNSYKERAFFFSITNKTVSALVGMVMSRPPQLQHTDEMNVFFKERQGAQFLEIASTTIEEVLLMGGYGILIDAPQDGAQVPRLPRYSRESIINWKVDDSGRPTLIVLCEEAIRNKADDEYEFEIIKRYRKLYLDLAGQYRSALYDDDKSFISEVIPTLKGQPLDHIPFYMFTPLGLQMDIMKPPMLDIVDLNISHYRTSADLEHGRHFTGLPTPVIIGMEKGDDMYIGSQAAWILPNPDADAKYLEFTGQGLTSLERALSEKQSQMASMSARMLDNSKRGSEAAETVKLRYMSESASLITVTRSVEDGFNQLYAEVAEIMGTEAPTIQFNKEFLDPKLTPAELDSLVNAYLEGTISKETLIYNLRKGDIISAKRTDEEELSEIKDPPERPDPNAVTARKPVAPPA